MNRQAKEISPLIFKSLRDSGVVTNEVTGALRHAHCGHFDEVVTKVCSTDLKESATFYEGNAWIRFCNGYAEVYLFF
jgi:hypothetical protein